jgi:DNA repair protein RadC
MQLAFSSEYVTAQRREGKRQKLIRQIRELSNQLTEELKNDRPKVQCPSDTYDLIGPQMACLEQEELWVICLNTRGGVIRYHSVYRGSLNSSQVRVGEIFRVAIIENAASIIVAHNHPSGDSTPSPDDVAVTRAVVQAGKLLDVEVLDHLIISAVGFTSLKERGLGF